MQDNQINTELNSTPPPVSWWRSSWAKRFWWLLVIVLIIAAVLALIRPKSPRSSQEEGGSARTEEPTANCTDSDPIFTANFTDLGLISQIGPLGGLNVGSASRSYIQVAQDAAGNFVSVPLYAPVDATLTGIYHKLANYGDLGSRSEYRLEFEVGCDVQFAFDHISNVTPAISAAGPAEASEQSNKGNSVSIPVKAGEQLGSTDGTKISGNWDFYLFNRAKPVDHINAERWESEHNIYADCPYDYFTDELKNQYLQKLALWDGQPLTPISCGQINHDVAGSASGGWFKDDSTDMQGTHLLLSNTGTMVEILREESMDQIERRNPRFGFRTHTYPKLPRDVVVGDAVCYSGEDKYLFVKLIDNTTLQTAYGTGGCPTTFPTSDVEEWKR